MLLLRVQLRGQNRQGRRSSGMAGGVSKRVEGNGNL